MNENNAVNVNPWMSILGGLISGDKGFVFLLLSLVGAYGVKRYFDSTAKAMELGYNTTVTSLKYRPAFPLTHKNGYSNTLLTPSEI